MAGGGSRGDNGTVRVSSSNVFAALDSLRRKKKPDQARKEPSKAQVWAPVPLPVKSWADVEDDDDDDYFANTAPLPPVWGAGQHRQAEAVSAPEESESEDDTLGYRDEDEDEEPEQEQESSAPTEPVKKLSPPLIVSKEPERQLSKKELKKKEFAELEAVLAEYGVPEKEEGKPERQRNGTMGKMENTAPAAPPESKTSKKKKKNASKEAKDSQDKLDDPINQAPVEATVTEPGEGDASAVDVKERLKKAAPTKKKKSSKELDTAAKAAAIEAAIRSAKLAAAKKKEKNHYNQQPAR